MGQPFVGEIRMFGGSFAPAGWAFCDGQLMPISENETLFQLIGTTYGGDGESTFAMPDLRSRVPVHQGQGQGQGLSSYVMGQAGGVETVTVTVNQMPGHTHAPQASSSGGTTNVATGAVLSNPGTTTTNTFVTPMAGASQVALNNSSITGTGGSQPHENMQPTLFISYIISLFGVFPSQT